MQEFKKKKKIELDLICLPNRETKPLQAHVSAACKIPLVGEKYLCTITEVLWQVMGACNQTTAAPPMFTQRECFCSALSVEFPPYNDRGSWYKPSQTHGVKPKVWFLAIFTRWRQKSPPGRVSHLQAFAMSQSFFFTREILTCCDSEPIKLLKRRGTAL